MIDEKIISKDINKKNANEKDGRKKKCSRCGRELPLERFSDKKKKSSWCKNCCSVYSSEIRGFMSEESIVKIERIYKEPLPQRILDAKLAEIKLISDDECFVRLINYKNAWISNYGRPLEFNNGKYVFKRIKADELGEKVCTLQKNVNNG